jgi:hypothetical protein
MRAEVAIQGEQPIRPVPGREVRVDIGAAEPVDRLFRIADEIEGMPAVAEKGGEDLPLGRVGVLKLVDQGGGIAPAQDGAQPVAAGAAEGCGQAQDEIVVGHRALASQPVVHLAAQFLGQGRPQGQVHLRRQASASPPPGHRPAASPGGRPAFWPRPAACCRSASLSDRDAPASRGPAAPAGRPGKNHRAAATTRQIPRSTPS